MIKQIKIGSNTHNITATQLPYGVCSTAAATAAKTVTVPVFTLETGATVIVKFTYANSVASPTLNVNSTGAKAIKIYGTTAASTDTTTTGWAAGAVQMFTYDGTNWVRDYWNNTHAVSSVNSKTGAVELSGYDVKAIPTFGQHNYNADECYDAGLFMIANGSGCPSSSHYGALLSLPYRKASGNEIPDFGTQIYIPNGDDAGYPNSLFFRTSLGGSWNAWQEVAKKSDIPNAYTLPNATSSTLGGVKIGSNITISSGTISLTKANVTTALGYTPPTSDTNTTYTFATGDGNGQIKVTPAGGSAQNISVKGLGSAAYTASTNYMDLASAQTAKGVKTFTDGINIGSAKLTYDTTKGALVISF